MPMRVSIQQTWMTEHLIEVPDEIAVFADSTHSEGFERFKDYVIAQLPKQETITASQLEWVDTTAIKVDADDDDEDSELFSVS